MTYNLQNGTTAAAEGVFVVKGHTPEDVAREMIRGGQTESFFVFDMDEAYRRIQHFKEVMPRVQIFYAMKANDWELMLKLVISQGLGFDCASPGEISKVLKLGISPTSIIFASPTKTAAQMIYAKDVGVKHTTFDSSYELKKIKEYWPCANLLLRIKVESESVYQLSDKFGCDFETEAKYLLDEAAQLGLKVVGIAFHVGGLCSSTESHAEGVQRARALFDYEASAGRHNMKIVDIGGGFPMATEDIDPAAKLINEALEQYFPDRNIQVIAEPGRYLCEGAAALYNSILSMRKITKNNQSVNMIYMNDGLHGTLRYTEYYHTAERLKKEDNGISTKPQELHDTILWGPTCDSTDRVFGNCQIPLPACSPSDWLVFNNRGAYSFNFQGTFSSIGILKMRAIVTEGLWNKIKNSPVFSPTEFVLKPNISEPLPSYLFAVPKIPTINPSLANFVLKVV